MDVLAAYNGGTSQDILQIDQKLRIPTAAAAAAAQPTATKPPAKPSPTTKASTPTPTITPEVPIIAPLTAPILVSPGDGDGFSSGTQPVLTWRPAAGIGANDYYYVYVAFTTIDGRNGFVEGKVSGTAFTVPQWVFETAAPPDRLSQWTVQVRRAGPSGQVIELSPPSTTRTFYWR